MARLCTAERRMGAVGIDDGKGALVEEVQDSRGIVEELKGLTTGVDGGGSDPELPQSVDIDIDIRGRVPDRQTVGGGGSGVDRNRIGEEDCERNAEGRRDHHDSGGGRRGDSGETLGSQGGSILA